MPPIPIESVHPVSRRHFLGTLAQWTFWGTLALSAIQPWLFWLQRSQATLARAGVFRLGRPETFAVGQVVRFSAYQLWLVRTAEGFYALHNACTHLGCPPQWQPLVKQFQCYCHGSQFSMAGTRQRGPANRAMERLAIAQASDGAIVVDTNRRFRQERGEWGEPAAFLAWRA